MNKFINSLYGRISAVFLILLLIVGVVQILITINSSLKFVWESEQQLNRNLAQDLANEFKPFLKDSLGTEGIEHTIHHLMVMNPRVEIYLLDEVGQILAFFADPKKKVNPDIAIAYYPASTLPPPDLMAPFPPDRKSGLEMAARAETVEQALARRARGGKIPDMYIPAYRNDVRLGQSDQAAETATSSKHSASP